MRLDAVAVEQVGSIVEPQLQPLARHRHQAHGVMRGVVPGDVGEPQTAGIGREGAAVDRIVLEHHQGVEQLAQSGQPLDLRKPEMLVRHQAGLTVLHLLAAARATACSAGSLIRSGSVLMNSPTMLSMPAISGGRPATVTPNTTSSRPVSRPSRMRPGRLDHGVEREALRARLPGQRRGHRLAQLQRDLSRA